MLTQLHQWKQHLFLLYVCLMLLGSLFGGCKTKVIEVIDGTNGTCVNCHRGLSNPHPVGAAIGCVNCHGGDASQRPFLLAGDDVSILLETQDPNRVDPNGNGRLVGINPVDIADERIDEATLNTLGIENPFLAEPGHTGRESRAFQVVLSAAHNLPKGCAGPVELVDLEGDGLQPVRLQDLTPAQQAALPINNNISEDCHAVFFWPNGMDDDGDGFVDELGEFSMFNPTDPTGLQFEFSKVLAKLDDPANGGNGNGELDPDDAKLPIGLEEAKTLKVQIDFDNDGVLDEVEVPVKLGQFLDSEFNIDNNYVRWLNPGDLRAAQASCGRDSPANSFLGNCHGLEVDTTRRSIMSYMSGVLAGAVYANGAMPHSKSPVHPETGQTDRELQDLREGRIAYLQNYDSIDQAFDTDKNRFVLGEIEGEGVRNLLKNSSQNQVDWEIIFGVVPAEDAFGRVLQNNGLDQDDCIDPNLDNFNLFTGNLCLESYPEALFRVDDVQLAAIEKVFGDDIEGTERVTTSLNGASGAATVEHGGDEFQNNSSTGARLVWKQTPLQDPNRSLFVLAPIPRRTLVGVNPDLLTNAAEISGAVTDELDVTQKLILPELAPDTSKNVVNINGKSVLDDRQFSNSAAGINPVDTALQTFRPFHSLSFPNLTGDFFFLDEFQLLDNNPNNDVFILRNNPHGRGRGTGCTSCHMLYDADGVNREPEPTVRFNGKQTGDIFLGRSSMVNGGQGLRTSSLNGDVEENGDLQANFFIELEEADKWGEIRKIIATALQVEPENLARLQYPTGMDDFGRERFYPSQHKITTQIPSQQCEYCHAFVSRVGFAALGRHENEGGMEFINWYTWTVRDFDRDQKITHKVQDNNFNGLADGNEEADLGQFIANRPASPQGDFLEFRNAEDPTQKVRIFNNLPAFDGTNFINTGARGTEDLINNGLLDPGENISDLVPGDPALDLPDRPARQRVMDGRQQRAVYGGPSGAVLLQDAHLEKGMQCIDCHFFQDNHGDGNLYARNWDAIEIKCIDCHGTATKKATLVTSGPNGGHDLTLSKTTDSAEPFFEIGDKGERIQRSRMDSRKKFTIPQIVDSLNPDNLETFSKDAAEAMGVLEFASLEGKTIDHNAHIAESQVVNGVERVGAGKLECSSCHSSWTPNCMTCHMDFDYGQTVGEIWATQGRNPISFFQLFTIIRSPFLLAQSGSNDRNRIMPQRSLMELHPNITLNDGDALGENLTFSTPRGLSGVAINQYMPHTVRRKASKDCESCHTMTPNELGTLQAQANDNTQSPYNDILNNNILSQTLGLGSGRLGELGDFAFAASSFGLEGVDVKSESKRALDKDGDGIAAVNETPNHNTFQGFRGQGFGSGFLIASFTDEAIINLGGVEGLNLDRNFEVSLQNGGTDIVLVRNFIDPTEKDSNTGMFIGEVRALDLAILATGNQLQLGMVTDRTEKLFPVIERLPSGTNTVTLGGTVTAIDHMSPDMSDPFVFAVTDKGNGLGSIEVVDLRTLALGRTGFNGNPIAAQAEISGTPTDIEIDGNFAFVLNKQDANASLQIIDARSTRFFDREVNEDSTLVQVAVDFLFATPGSLEILGEAPLTGCSDPRKVAVFHLMAYIACGTDGLFVVNIEDPLRPLFLGTSQDAADFNLQSPGTSLVDTGALDDAQGVFASDNRLFVSNGNAVDPAHAAVVVFDVTQPKNPRPVRRIRRPGTMIDPVDIISFVVPGQQWLLVSDSGGNDPQELGKVHAVNVSEAYNIRVRLGEHAAASKGLLGAAQETEKEGSVPGFRPEENLGIFRSQGLSAPRPFFEDTNVRFTLDLRDWMTPNDPAQIDEILANAEDPDSLLHIITFDLAGKGDIRLAQTSELDRMADFSGFPIRDSWASSVEINPGCKTDANGGFSNTDCASDTVNNLGSLGARPLSGPRFIGLNNQGNALIVRGVMDTMRGVFVKEDNGIDTDGNGLGNLSCIGIAQRDPVSGSIIDMVDCKELYPQAIRDALEAKD